MVWGWVGDDLARRRAEERGIGVGRGVWRGAEVEGREMGVGGRGMEGVGGEEWVEM